MKDTLCFCATYSYFKEGALKALKRDAMVLTRYVEVVCLDPLDPLLRYHLSKEGIWQGYLFYRKRFIKSRPRGEALLFETFSSIPSRVVHITVNKSSQKWLWAKPVPGIRIVECGVKEESKQKIRRKRVRGREEGTSARFVFRRLLRSLCQLVIQTSFLVLKVVNQATGNQPHCVLNFHL